MRKNRVVNSNNAVGNIPTTDSINIGDVALRVVQHSCHRQDDRQRRDTLWQRYRVDDLQSATLKFSFVTVLFSEYSREIWICDLTSSSPNEVLVNNGAYKIILHVHPSGGVVIANSSVDCTGSQLPPHARLYTVLLPAGVPMIYRATLKLIKELEDGVAVCDEIVFRVKTNLPEKSFIYHYQSGDYLSVEYPLPKFKLEGVLRHPFVWSTIMHFEEMAGNGHYLLFRRHRKMLQNWAKTRPRYQDLVAMVLNEEGVACLIKHRLEEAVNLAKRACRLSSYYSCVNDRTIRGYAAAVCAAAERFAGNQDRAKEQLADALEIFEPMEPSTYTSMTLYNIGAIIMERSATVGVSDSEEREAESFLQKAAEHWMYQELNTTRRLIPRVCTRLISLYLKSSPNTAPNLDVAVSQDNMRRAGEVIRRFETLFPQCSNWMKSTFYLCKADHCIRSRDIDGGLRAAQQAVVVSKQSGLQRETTGAIRRVNLLRELDDYRRRPATVPDCL